MVLKLHAVTGSEVSLPSEAVGGREQKMYECDDRQVALPDATAKERKQRDVVVIVGLSSEIPSNLCQRKKARL